MTWLWIILGAWLVPALVFFIWACWGSDLAREAYEKSVFALLWPIALFGIYIFVRRMRSRMDQPGPYQPGRKRK